MGAVQTARQRARAELTREIVDAARRNLVAEGPSGLSLRAVARELGMVSSAIYRYFPSRDDLLTTLIIDAYDAVGEAAERADAGCAREDIIGRWAATSRAVRGWAIAHPHEYALVYGSPVPGYRAPEDTIGPASRVTNVLVGLVCDAAALGALAARATPSLPVAMVADARRLADLVLPGVGPETLTRAIVAWTQLFGIVSYELFGHLVGSVEDPEVLFESSIVLMADFIGLRESRRRKVSR
jgi:AcrR family transcriptional regulator